MRDLGLPPPGLSTILIYFNAAVARAGGLHFGSGLDEQIMNDHLFRATRRRVPMSKRNPLLGSTWLVPSSLLNRKKFPAVREFEIAAWYPGGELAMTADLAASRCIRDSESRSFNGLALISFCLARARAGRRYRWITVIAPQSCSPSPSRSPGFRRECGIRL